MTDSFSEAELRAGLVRYRRAMNTRRLTLVGILAGYVVLTFLAIVKEVHRWPPPAKDLFLLGFAVGLVAIAAYTIATSGRFQRAHEVRCPACGRSLAGARTWEVEQTGLCTHCNAQLLPPAA